MTNDKKTWRERFEETVSGGISDAMESLNNTGPPVTLTPADRAIAIVSLFAVVLLILGFLIAAWGAVRLDLGTVRVGVVLDLAMLAVLKAVQVVAQRRAKNT
jgi:hypothetical protein